MYWVKNPLLTVLKHCFLSSWPTSYTGASTLSITTFSIMTLSIIGLRCDTQRTKVTITMVSHYAKFCIIFITLQNAVMLNVLAPDLLRRWVNLWSFGPSHLGRQLKGPAIMTCFYLLVLLVAASN